MMETFDLITSIAQMWRRLLGKERGGAVTELRPLSLAFPAKLAVAAPVGEEK